VPRPRPPRRNSFGFDDDRHLSNEAGLDSTDPEFRRLKREASRLVANYLKNWKPRRGPGRRDETPRNDLIVDLAAAFHARSGWRSEGKPDRDLSHDYRSYLKNFLNRVLAANGIYSIPQTRLLRIVPRQLRSPR
jgi:hypothetical protein